MKVTQTLKVEEVPAGAIVRAKVVAAAMRVTLKDYVVLALMERIKVDEARIREDGGVVSRG